MKTNSLEFDAQALREKILDLAMRGKLVKQDPTDEPASVLLEKIKAEKAELVKEGKIKKSKALPEITDDEKPFDIPDSWEWVRLGEVGEIISGGTPKTTQDEYWIDGNIPWITPAVMSSLTKEMYFKNSDMKFINESGLNNSSAHIIPKNSIVMSSRAPIGYVNIVPFDYTTNQGCKSVVPFKGALNKYLYFALQTRIKDMEKRASGTTFKEISGTKFEQTVIPLPPLKEQSRIAAKIAELFALLRKVESSNQQYDEFKKMLRSKVLDLAMRGKLVEQNPDDEPASVLLEKIKTEKAELVKEGKIKKSKSLPEITDEEKPFDIPDSWEWVRLGDVIYNYDGKRIPVSVKERKNQERNYDYYGASGIIDKVSDYIFDRPLLLISEDGANLLARNKPIAFIATGKYWVNNHAHVLDGWNLNLLKYISLYINGVKLNKYISGSAQPKLNQKNMDSIPIPLPPFDEQKRIIKFIKVLNVF